MKTLRLKELLKLAQNAEIDTWKAIQDEVMNGTLPAEVMSLVSEVKELQADAEKLNSGLKEAKSFAEGLPPEEKTDLKSVLTDPDVAKAAKEQGGGKITASSFIDAILVKQASKYFGKKDASEIIREINIYKNLNGINIKIASIGELERSLLEKEAAFKQMVMDERFLMQSSLLKISQKHSGELLKEGASAWESVKNIGSEVLNIGSKGVETAGKGLGIAGKGIGAVAKGTWSVIKTVFHYFPIIGVVWAAYDFLESSKNKEKAFDAAKKLFSEFGNEEVIFDSEYISKLISNFKNDAEKMLKVTQLNELAKFYRENFLKVIYSVAWFISDLIATIGIIAGIVGTVATGGVLGVIISVVAGLGTLLGIGSAIGAVSTHFFDVGVGEYLTNAKEILATCNQKISELSKSGAGSATPSEAPSTIPTDKEMSDEEAMAAFRALRLVV